MQAFRTEPPNPTISLDIDSRHDSRSCWRGRRVPGRSRNGDANNTEAGPWNRMRERRSFRNRRERGNKGLWSPAGKGNQERTKGERPVPKTGSRFQTGSQKLGKNGNRLVSMNSRTCPVENQGLTRARTGREKREPVLGTGLHPEAETERNQGSGKDPPKPTGRSP